MDLGTDTSGAGSINDLLGGGADATAAAAAAGAGGDAGGAGDAGTGGGSDVPQDFLALFPADTPDGETASLQDWVKATGVKDAATLAKIARDNQKALRESGRIKVPGEGATPQEVAEYRAAIGVPDAPTGYAVPEFKDAAGNPIPINTALTERIFANAHKIGLPKTAAEQLVADEIKAQLAEYDAGVKALQDQAKAHIASWGNEREQGMAQVNAALKELGFDRQDLEHMRAMPGGVGKFLDAMRKVGSNFTEDTLIKGDRQTFGMTAETAQAELRTMQADPAIAAKIMVPGTPERIKRDRLLDIVASAGAA